MFVRVETDSGIYGVGESTFNGFARTTCNNYLIQEIFDQYDVACERDLVTWHAELNEDGTLSIPDNPGLGIDLNIDEIEKHPYHEGNYLVLYIDDWNKRGINN